MNHVILKSRTSRPNRFRTLWEPIEYACRITATGSLRPVPPGTTRERLYCGQCKAAKCLFTGVRPASAEERASREAEEQKKRHERYLRAKERYLRAKAERRAKGLSTNCLPLRRTCWNCTELRAKLGGYVCRFEPEAEPEHMPVMIHRHADGCEAFGLRRVLEIPPLDIGD